MLLSCLPLALTKQKISEPRTIIPMEAKKKSDSKKSSKGTYIYSTLAGDKKASAEAKASKGAGRTLVYDREESVKRGRHAFKAAGSESTKYGEGGRVKKILKRAQKKAARIHDREARKEAKGKDVKVVGTREIVTSVWPRLMGRNVEKRKVYAKEREAINKGDARAAKVEGRQATRPSKRPKVKPPRIRDKKSRPSRGRSRRADRPTGGRLKKFLQNRKNIRRNKKKNCFGRGDC